MRRFSWPLFMICWFTVGWSDAPPTPLQTVAERSGFEATSRHADVVAFCRRLARQSSIVHLTRFGTSFEGRELPLLILADPPVTSPAQAAHSGKLVVFAMGNIHAGEVDGKEALLMLAREVATGKHRDWLENLVLLVAPILNADGNERLAEGNRPGQNGPSLVGQRANAQGLDLNRDFVKLESPEVRALVRLFNEWDPAIFIDMHTTNGSRHRYLLTYDGPRHATVDERLVHFIRDRMLPEVTRRLERDSLATFFYGNFSSDRKGWRTYPALPRYGVQYVGLRNRIGILSESYSYAPFRDRIDAGRRFVSACFDYAAENRKRLALLLRSVDDRTARAGRQPRPDSPLILRCRAAPLAEPVVVRGFSQTHRDQPHDYRMQFWGRCEPVISVPRPFAYLVPTRCRSVTTTLQRHGVAIEQLARAAELQVETYRVDRLRRNLRQFQKHHLMTAFVTKRKVKRLFPAGTIVVRTGQRLGTLAGYLLEPEAEDGLCAWNFLDADLAEGEEYPVVRLPRATELATKPVAPKEAKSH